MAAGIAGSNMLQSTSPNPKKKTTPWNAFLGWLGIQDRPTEIPDVFYATCDVIE